MKEIEIVALMRQLIHKEVAENRHKDLDEMDSPDTADESQDAVKEIDILRREL